jgi:sugar phosphate isomerase/epimerase
MNKLGIMSYIYNGWTAEAMAAEIRRHGLGYIQLDPKQSFGVMDEDPFSIERAHKIKDIFLQHGIRIVALSGYSNLVHPDAAKREKKIQEVEKRIDLCAAYGTRYLATETGSLHPTNGWRDCEENRSEEAWQLLTGVVDRLRRRAVKGGAVLLIEGFINNVLSRPEQAALMTEQLGTEGLAFVMDPFNYLAREDLDLSRQQPALERVFQAIAAYTPIAHAKDTLYTDDGIKTPRVGAGEVQWSLYASMLQRHLPDAPLIVEHADPNDVGDVLTLIQNAFAAGENYGQ